MKVKDTYQNGISISPIWHILFWVLYYSIYCISYAAVTNDLLQIFGLELVELPVKIAFTYFLLFYLIPHFLLDKKYLKFIAWLFIGIIVAVILQRLMINLISYNFIYSEFTEPKSVFDWHRNLAIMARIYSAAIPAAALKAIVEWYQFNQKLQTIKNEKLSAELSYLKTQLNPHFFFNTLNNLYGLTLEKSANAPKVVLLLSDLMSYLLYDTDANEVPLTREITHIKNYIELEKIRFGERFDFSLNISGPIEKIQIAPLLLLPFVENSFKHGINEEIEQAWINMDIQAMENKLVFKIDNSVPESYYRNGLSEVNQNSGIGLENVRRRLELLYPDAHDLKILNQENIFLVSLTIELNALNKPRNND